jgi:hypothetical protein
LIVHDNMNCSAPDIRQEFDRMYVL